jgi:ubiquinone/menaquinone biosynthesis C-methylase UbiE
MSGKPVAAGKSSFDLIDVETTMAVMDVKPGSIFLDLACGVGNYTFEIAKLINEEGTVYAVDLWAEGIDVLNRLIEVKGITNIKPICADITGKLPLEEDSVDACLMATILHDLSTEDQEAAIKEVARLTRPGGKLNIIEFKKTDKGPGPPQHIRMTEGDIAALVTPHGFVKVAGTAAGEFTRLLKYERKI